MAELGGGAADYHRRLGEHVARSAVDVALFIGPLSVYASEATLQTWPSHRVQTYPRFNDDCTQAMSSLIRPGDTVLIKASRSAGLERLVPVIESALQRTESKPTMNSPATAP